MRPGEGLRLTERSRNTLLRRVDWRFLLPNPRPRKTVCYAAGTIGDAVALISDTVVIRGRDSAVDCDLAVAVNPDAATLRAAWNALRPGGSLYVEWRSCDLTTGASARRLRRLGFRDVLSYWPYPNPAWCFPQLWVPLESRGALQYCLDHDPGFGSIGFVLRRMARSIIAHVLWQPRVWSMCTTAMKPHADRDGESQPLRDAAADRLDRQRTLRTGIFETIRRRWDEWGLGTPPDGLTWLLLTRGGHSSNKIVAAVIGEAHTTPCIAIKMARTPEGAAAVQREARNLEALAGRPLRIGVVPRPLFCQTHAGVLTVAETFIPGRLMTSRLTRRTFRDLVRRGADWLTALATPTGPSPSPAAWTTMLDRTLAEFESSFGAVLDRTMLHQTYTALSALEPLPAVFEHRDFSPTNIVITPHDQLGVLDWESAEPAGIPFLDLIYFVTNAAFIVDNVWGCGPYRDSYRRTWDSATIVGAVVGETIARYARATGIHSPDLSALRLLVWLIHSRSEYTRLVATSGSAPGNDALRKSLFFSLWETELQQRSDAATVPGFRTPIELPARGARR